jgi:hypothetical protein
LGHVQADHGYAESGRRCFVKYFVVPNLQDGTDLPTQPVPMDLDTVGKHIRIWLEARLKHNGGYVSNCRMERMPVGAISFRVVPETAFNLHQSRMQFGEGGAR